MMNDNRERFFEDAQGLEDRLKDGHALITLIIPAGSFFDKNPGAYVATLEDAHNGIRRQTDVTVPSKMAEGLSEIYHKKDAYSLVDTQVPVEMDEKGEYITGIKYDW